MKTNKKASTTGLILLLLLIGSIVIGAIAINSAKENFEEICKDLGYNHQTDYSSAFKDNIIIECDYNVIKNITIIKEMEQDKWGEDKFNRYWYKKTNETK